MNLNIPAVMKALPHWVLWRKETREGKPTKVPYQAQNPGQLAKSNDPATWCTFDQAEAAAHLADGIGFQAGSLPCGIVLLDLDHCLIDGELLPWAHEIMTAARSYTEISPSGDGLHVFFGGTLPGPSIKTSKAEIYDRLRYFTVTGKVFDDFGAFRTLTPEEIAKVYSLVLATKPIPAAPATIEPARLQAQPGQQALIRAMIDSKAGPAIEALLRGDTAGYSGDQSAADLALCSHLSFWTDRNPADIDQIFRQSGLYREKWDKRHSGDGRTYGEMTIQKAIAGTSETISTRRIIHEQAATRIDGTAHEPESTKAATISRPREFTEQVKHFYEHGREAGLSTGWPSIDKVFSACRKFLYVLTGFPGSGKTEFVLDLAMHLSMQHAFRWNIFSPENYPAESIIQNLTEKYKKRQFFGKARMPYSEVAEAVDFIDSHFALLGIPDESVTLDMVLNAAKESPADGLIIDPWNEIESTRPASLTATEFIGQSLQKLRRFARQHNQMAIVVAHPAKMRRLETGAFPIPDLYDISDSAHWRNKPDFGIVVYRNEETCFTDIHVKKARFKYYATLGMQSLVFDVPTGTFREIGDTEF